MSDLAAGPNVVTDDRRSVATDDADISDLAELLAAVLAAEGVRADAECSLSLVDPDEIAELKAQYLEGDGAPTDVLSFPIDGLEQPEGGEGWMVGDVVVCPAVAAAQASGHAGTTADELALLVVHGGLHLVGWDHATEDQRQAMWSRERELMIPLYGEPTRDPWNATESTAS